MTPNHPHRQASVKSKRRSSYTISRRRPTTRDRICLRWRTTLGGPCNSPCSAPRAVRAHISMSGSRGNTTNPTRSQPPERRRHRQDIVLSASASIPAGVSPPLGGTQTLFLRSTHLRDGTRQSSHKLLTEYQSLRRKRYWGQHLWSREYWVATSGNVTDEVWKKYIDNQKPEEPDDNFKVV
jgi:hypothetical protein